uniref:Heat shock protein family A member 12 variant X2 n=1 Tax=Urechis unicinctus TaxID=6432 RepID=A0AAU0MUF1_UREUN
MAKTDAADELVRLLNALHAHNKGMEEAKAAAAISEPPKDYIMVGAIDFGTTFSGYAFSFKSQKDDIRMFTDWGSGVGLSGCKAPTCVLTNAKGDFEAFGYEAEQKYANLDETEVKKYCFYDRFKMRLHTEKNLGRSTQIKARNGKNRSALEVFSMALRYLKSHLIDAVEKQSSHPISRDHIRWVITVPAIWSDASKQFMREAAFLAGIIKDVESTRLLIALEPEAASLYCRTLDIEHLVTGSYTASVKMAAGVKYLVLDAGGGTLDVTAHQLLGDASGRVRELYQASGGNLGGTQVDKHYVELLEKIFGKDVLDRYRKECAAGWLQFMCTFERIKRSVKTSGTTTTNIPIPFELGETYVEIKGKPLRRGIQDYQKINPGVRFNAGMLCLSNDVMVKLFTPVVKGIVDHMKTLMALSVMEGVTHLMMVGGFSDSPVLQDAIKDALGTRLNIIIPHDASLCVIKGAAIFGHDPSLISTRIARKTYGIEVTQEFDTDIHDINKKEVVDGVPHCMEIFKVLVQKGEEVEIGNTRLFNFTPLRANQTGADIKIYSSDQKSPKYVKENGVSYHGNIHINLSGLGINRLILITVMFGGTEIHVHAKDGSCGADGHFATTRVQFMTE